MCVMFSPFAHRGSLGRCKRETYCNRLFTLILGLLPIIINRLYVPGDGESARWKVCTCMFFCFFWRGMLCRVIFFLSIMFVGQDVPRELLGQLKRVFA